MLSTQESLSEHMYRNLDAVEELLLLCEQRFTRGPVIVAELNRAYDQVHWHRSLEALQRHHPLLTLRIRKERGRRPGLVHTSEPLRITFHDLFEDFSPSRAMESGMQTSFGDGIGPLFRLHVYEGQHRTVLLLSFHHALLDGRGGLRILRDLLTLASGSQLPSSPLSKPSYPELLQQADDWTYETVLAEDPKQSTVEQAEANELRVNATVLDRELTRRLAVQAHAHQVSVHGVLIGTLALAVARLAKDGSTDPYVVITSVDLRPLFAISDVPACLLFMIPHALGLAGRSKDDIWQIATKVMDEVLQGRSRETVAATYAGILGGIIQEKTPEEAYAVTCAASGDMWINNYGKDKLPVIYGDLHLRRVWTGSSAGKPSCQKVDLLTLAGEMMITVTSQRSIGGLLDETTRLLRSAVEAA